MFDYEAPIKVIYGQLQTQFEDDILKAVQSYRIEVNKEELIKALRYDRGQFDHGHAVGYADGYGDACAEAKRPKWISVEDRLPELHTKVLCCGVKGGRFIAELSTWGKEKRPYWDRKSGKGCPEVTHWMPLPEPPKG